MMELDPLFCFSHLEDDLHSTLSDSLFVESSQINEVFQELEVFSSTEDGSNKPLVVVGEYGVGKSAALKNWTARRKANTPLARRLDYTECVFWHTIGCSRLSTQVTHLLRRLVNELIAHFDLKESMDLADEKLPWILPRLLERAGKRGRVIVVIDGGLQHICSQDKDYGLKWLPLSLPPNVRMILAATTPSTERDQVQELTDHAKNLQTKVQQTWNEIQRRKWPTLPLECLKDDLAQFIQKYLSQLSQSREEILLDQRKHIIEMIRTHPLSNNVLFLTFMLRAISHADSLGYNVHQCLISWMPCRTAVELIQLILALFESGLPRKSALGESNVSRLGPMLGDSLSLLFVARHGLHEKELFELLGRVNQQSHWNRETQGTVVPVKLKILQVLKNNKNRLIDIFRSFDTDGNGTLSHDEFYAGMERLNIDVSHDEVTMLIREVDSNNDGEIDYQETLEHFEHLARSYSHGKRGVSVFARKMVAIEDLSPTEEHKQILISTLICVGVNGLDTKNGSVLTLPFENTALRDAIWSRYISTTYGKNGAKSSSCSPVTNEIPSDSPNNEAKYRSFIIERFSKKEPSLRYCEELPWLLKKFRSWPQMKKILVDLRTLDIMFTSSELKSELFNYLRVLTIGGKIKFDIVTEYNQSLTRWVQKSNPSAKQISMMSHFITDVMGWFSKSIAGLKKPPPFMRESLEDTYLQTIGIDLTAGRDRMSDTAGPRTFSKRRADRMDPEAQYFFNRWVWIQFPWLALKNASVQYQENVRQLKNESTTPLAENMVSTDQSTISSRDKAMAGIASPMLRRLEKLDSLEPRTRSLMAIPLSTVTPWESKIGVDANSKNDASFANATKQLRELKHIHDSLGVEADSKEKQLHELQSTTKSREVDDTKIHRRITVGQKSIREFQNRLDQLEALMDTASHVDRIYQNILLMLHQYDPVNQNRHLQLEQQLRLSRQQIADLRQERVRKSKEIEKIEARSKTMLEEVKLILREREKIRPRLQMLQIQMNEESEERTERIYQPSFDPTVFSRRVRLKGRIAKRRENKLKHGMSTSTFSSAEINKMAKLHPMERLAQASGTRDSVSIVEILNEDETQQLQARQEQGELQLKDQAATLESLVEKIKIVNLVDNDVKVPRVTCEDIVNVETMLSSKQTRLVSISQLIQHISQAVLNLNDMVHSSQDNKPLSEVAQFTMEAADPCKQPAANRSIKLENDIKKLSQLIGSLHKQIPLEINLLLRKEEPSRQEQTRYQNIRILNRAEQESQVAIATKTLRDHENEDIDDCEQDTNEDFGKLASYVDQGIKTNASQNQQRRANLVSHAKQGKYASKGIILEAVMQSASFKNSSP